MAVKKTGNLAEYFFHEGTNFNAYDFLGVHKIKKGKKEEYVFRTWAPNAEQVFVSGDFNNWAADRPMKRINDQGLWEGKLSADEFGEGSKYKFIVRNFGRDVYKADPYAFFCEEPPATASVYYDISGYEWKDSKWLAARSKKMKEPEYSVPMNIYEIHTGSWKQHEDGSLYNYRELAHELAPYVKEMGYTHVELLPIAEHPFGGSWGYQVCGYYAPTARHGNPHDFKYFVDYMHKCGIGVILDWVPAHFPKDEHGLYNFDGTPLYEYQGADKNEYKGWGTRRFDVGRNEVQSFLMSNALFWLREYHADGLRVDAVASMLYLDFCKEPGEWLPNAYGGNECLEAVAFFKKLGGLIRQEFPDALFIAEESTAWRDMTKPAEYGGLGFNYKWNMGWMNDILDYFETDPVFRKYKHDKLTFSMFYAFSENYVLPISHDEVVHGKKSLLDKMPGDYWQKFAGYRAFMAYMMTHPGKKLLFMGSEYAPFREWDYENSLEWFMLDYDMHAKAQLYNKELNHLYIEHSELWEIDYSWDGFQWIDCDNKNESILSYLRKDKKGNELIIALNLTPVPRLNYPLGLFTEGTYNEIFNSDDTKYGGSGVVNSQPMSSYKEPRGVFENVIRVDLPPMGAVILKRT